MFICFDDFNIKSNNYKSPTSQSDFYIFTSISMFKKNDS